MPVNYTNRKGQTYTLYEGKTKTGKPRYYFGRNEQSQGEPIAEIPAGFTISESVNGVVSLVKERSPQILPEEVAIVDKAIKQHPQGRRYRRAAKRNLIEVYEQAGDDADVILKALGITGREAVGMAEVLQKHQERSFQYMPVMQFFLINENHREFGAKRMCYRSSIDGWLELMQTGSIEELTRKLIPTLGTDKFFELM